MGNFGKQEGSSRQQSSSNSSASSNVWDAQAPYLKSIYGGAADLFRRGPGPLTNANASMEGWITGPGGNIINDTSGAFARGVTGGTALGGLASANTGNAAGAINSFLAGPQVNPFLQQSVRGALGDVISQFTESALPSVRTSAGLAGQPGGTRQGIAEGIALGKLGTALANTAAGMYGDAYNLGQNQQLQAAQLASGNAAAAGNEMLGSLGLAGNVYNLGFAPAQGYTQMYQNQWAPVTNYAGLIGGPTVLNRSQSSSSGYGSSSNRGFNLGFA